MLLTKTCSLIITKAQLQVHLECRGKTTHGGNNLTIQNVNNKSSGLDFAKVNIVRENIVKRIVSELKKYTSNA